MKNKIILPLFAVLLISLFSSCEKDADVDLPETKPKLVIASFITPQDTTLQVTVTRSRPIFESYTINTGSAVENATVIMASSTGSVQLTYDALKECYTASATMLPITPGNTYSLTVTTPQGESAEATTTVPVHNTIGNYSVTMTDSLTTDGWTSTLTAQFTYQMNDYGGEENRYRFFAAALYRDSITGDTSSHRFANKLFTDDNADGQHLQGTFDAYWGYYYPFGNRVIIGYDCWMLNVDIHYYQFHNSLYNYSSGDPFSEPTLIYSNVKNGLGVFASANGSKLRIYR
jgi:hypothetical protein